jgi:hypothetical protein
MRECERKKRKDAVRALHRFGGVTAAANKWRAGLRNLRLAMIGAREIILYRNADGCASLPKHRILSIYALYNVTVRNISRRLS